MCARMQAGDDNAVRIGHCEGSEGAVPHMALTQNTKYEIMGAKKTKAGKWEITELLPGCEGSKHETFNNTPQTFPQTHTEFLSHVFDKPKKQIDYRHDSDDAHLAINFVTQGMVKYYKYVTWQTHLKQQERERARERETRTIEQRVSSILLV